MRNIFDQYSQPENQLTHSLACVLHHDRGLLKSFLKTFGPETHPQVKALNVIEQGLPGTYENHGGEDEERGLPDAVIFDEKGWALIIESKVSSSLTPSQLRRHDRTIAKCGYEDVSGLTITVNKPGSDPDNWVSIHWTDVYSWGHQHRGASRWARAMVDYFELAEARMAEIGYLKEGTITEFSGIAFDPYTYLEGKRVLRLLTKKLREDHGFMSRMGLDTDEPGRKAITRSSVLWDFLTFDHPGMHGKSFHQFPHCTIGVGPEFASAMLTFPNSMPASLWKRLAGDSVDSFTQRLAASRDSITSSLNDVPEHSPMARIMQRHYRSQRSKPDMDGLMEYDLRVLPTLEDNRDRAKIKIQAQWAESMWNLIHNKRANLQFQIGVRFPLDRCPELGSTSADRHFKDALLALEPFAVSVLA